MDLTQAREEQFQRRLDQIIEDKADHISELILESAIANNEHLVPLAKLEPTRKRDSHKIKNKNFLDEQAKRVAQMLPSRSRQP